MFWLRNRIKKYAEARRAICPDGLDLLSGFVAGLCLVSVLFSPFSLVLVDEICCKHSVRRNLGGPYLVVLLCVIGTNNSCSDLCSDFSNGFDRRALSKLNFVNTHDKEGCVVMFYEVEDIIRPVH